MISVTQKDNFGCGIACLAYALKIDYDYLIKSSRIKNQVENKGLTCRKLVEILKSNGLDYCYKYIKTKTKKIYDEGSIVFIRRYKRYPVGHYLIRTNNIWMDPWINFKNQKNVKKAKSGFRKKLPGEPIYVIFQIKK